MKRITDKIDRLSAFVAEEVGNRQATYENRSELWRQSDEGGEHSEYTEQLGEFGQLLGIWREKLEGNEL